LELDIPDPKLKDNVARKLLSYKDEIKEKILKQKKETEAEEAKGKKEKAAPLAITESPEENSAKISATETKDKSTPVAKESEKNDKIDEKPKADEKVKEKTKKIEKELPLDYVGNAELVMQKPSAPWALILLFFLLVGAGIATVYFYQQTGELQTKITRMTIALNNLKSDLRKQSEFISANKAVIDFLKKKDVEIVNLVGTANSPEAKGQLFLSFSEGKGLLKVDNLPGLKAGKVYHCWFVGNKESFDILQLNGENFNGVHAIPKLPYVEKKEINLIRITDENIDTAVRPEGNTYLYGAFPR